VNDPKTIPFESVQLPNTAPLQDLGENVSNDPVKTNNDFVVMPQVENAHEPALSPEKDQELKVVLSNVFTPNGDGTNDYLFIQSEGLLDFIVVVLNQKNQIIYQSTDAKFSWDGKLASGEEAPAANYIYFVTAKSSNGKFIQQSSTLLIQR
jgi:gliding motility-associated-like protein